MNNVLYINKPKGMTSFDICFKLRKVLGTKKIGHTGTLDPNATGVMIVLFNNGTKGVQFLNSDKKEYIAEVLLGINTDTLDIDGNIVETKKCVMPEKDEIITVLNSFLGKSIQIPPITSAIKVNGKKLYEYQREGKEVEIPKREIDILEIELLDIKEDRFTFRCVCTAGTYIRALMRDILAKMDLIGTLNNLKRTMVDDVLLNECDELEDVLNGKYHAHSLYDVLSKRYKTVCVDDIKDVLNGKRLKLNCDEETVLISKDGEAVAMYQKDKQEYRCLRGLL